MATFINGLTLRGTQQAHITLTAAVAFPVDKGATHFIVQARSKAIYYTIDGTTPTAVHTGTAFYVAADDSDIVPIPEGLDAIRIIEQSPGAHIAYAWLTAKGR